MDKDVILRQELSELDTQDIQQLMDGSGAFGDTTIDDIINSAADGSSIFEADNIIGSLKDLLIYDIKAPLEKNQYQRLRFLYAAALLRQ